jgi:Rrf2 family protein
MWISKRTDYATRAVLALALEAGEEAVKLEDLAQRTEVPASVLEQVMPTLRSAGIVRSERGAHGGYRLNKAPAEITVERIVRLFQGPLAPIGYATRRNPDPCPDRRPLAPPGVGRGSRRHHRHPRTHDLCRPCCPRRALKRRLSSRARGVALLRRPALATGRWDRRSGPAAATPPAVAASRATRRRSTTRREAGASAAAAPSSSRRR